MPGLLVPFSLDEIQLQQVSKGCAMSCAIVCARAIIERVDSMSVRTCDGQNKQLIASYAGAEVLALQENSRHCQCRHVHLQTA